MTFPWIDFLNLVATPIRHIMVYPSLKFGDVLAAFQGAMNGHSAKNPSKSLLVPAA